LCIIIYYNLVKKSPWTTYREIAESEDYGNDCNDFAAAASAAN